MIENNVNRRTFFSTTVAGVFSVMEAKAFFSSKKTSAPWVYSPPTDTFWVIPHTHWEAAVFMTRHEYLDMGLPHILTVLKLMKDHPEYHFALDHVSYIKPFLERYPEEATSFRQFVKEGRLEIVGGTDVMHDTNMPGGESIVRQMLYGKNYIRENLGVEVTVGWALDTFGHGAHMPQLLKLGGYKSYWFQRGVPNPNLPSEFLWEGIDGTKIPAFWPAKGYGFLAGAPKTLDEFTTFVKERFDLLTPHAQGGHDRMGLAGRDVEDPPEHLPVMVKEFARQKNPPFNLRFGVPTDFEETMSKRPNRRVIVGELNPIFQGSYSSRIDLKQKLRDVERLLTAAEKLGALGSLIGKPTTDEEVWRAWEPSLFNQAHDLMCGVMTDHVYEDTMRGYEFSLHLGAALVDARLDTLASQIDTSGIEIPIIIFNPLGWTRNDVAETEIGFTEDGVLDIEILDPDNRSIPVEILDTNRYDSGGLKWAKIIFIAKDVPALGYVVYSVSPLKSASKVNTTSASTKKNENDDVAIELGYDKPGGIKETNEGTIENEFYSTTSDLFTGAMTSLKMKATQWEVLESPGNVVARQYDGGDLWELYETLYANPETGGGRITMRRQQEVPKKARDQFSSEYKGEKGTVRRGPVFSEFKVEHNFGVYNTFPTSLQGTFSTAIRLYAGMRRIDIHTEILNNEKYVRHQVLFPTTVRNGKIIHEIPFGSIERSSAIEFPAQNWSDYSDSEKGLAVINRGLPGNLTSESTIILSLMRSASLMSYGTHRIDIKPWMTSLGGLMLGRKTAFDYALVPHEGDWRQGEVYRHGMEFNNPLIVHKTESHTGKLPRRWGLLEVSHPNVVITALKSGKDGSTILRLYEASGKATTSVIVKCNAMVRSAYEANLLEDAGAELKVERDTVRFDLGPFEIRTFKLRLNELKTP